MNKQHRIVTFSFSDGTEKTARGYRATDGTTYVHLYNIVEKVFGLSHHTFRVKFRKLAESRDPNLCTKDLYSTWPSVLGITDSLGKGNHKTFISIQNLRKLFQGDRAVALGLDHVGLTGIDAQGSSSRLSVSVGTETMKDNVVAPGELPSDVLPSDLPISTAEALRLNPTTSKFLHAAQVHVRVKDMVNDESFEDTLEVTDGVLPRTSDVARAIGLDPSKLHNIVYNELQNAFLVEGVHVKEVPFDNGTGTTRRITPMGLRALTHNRALKRALGAREVSVRAQ